MFVCDLTINAERIFETCFMISAEMLSATVMTIVLVYVSNFNVKSF